MARRLNGDLGEEVTDDSLFPRSPTTDRRHDPARRRDDPPGRRPVPGQFLLRHPALAPLPRHRLGRAQAPRRRKPAPVLTPEDLERLRELIRKQPDATLEECRAHLGASCSLMTISRALSQLGLPRKKKVPRA